MLFMDKIIPCLILFQQIFICLINLAHNVAVNLQFIVNNITAVQQFYLRMMF